jgi:hypothetical protein
MREVGENLLCIGGWASSFLDLVQDSWGVLDGGDSRMSCFQLDAFMFGDVILVVFSFHQLHDGTMGCTRKE